MKRALFRVKANTILATFVFIVFLLLIVVPVFYTIGTTLIFDGSLQNNLSLLDNSSLFLLLKSSMLAFSIAFLSTILGAIIAYLLYKTNIKYRGFFKIGFLIPLFVSPYILAVAWKDFFYFSIGSSSIISTYIGVIFVLTTIYTPLSMLIIGSALTNISTHLEESALTIVRLRRIILKITLPMIKPAIITSFVLIFILSISEFTVPAFFGVEVLTTEIFTQFSAFYNHSFAILQSTLLISICIVLLFIERRHLADAQFLSLGGKGRNNRLYELYQWKYVSFSLIFILFFIFIILPFIILFYQSFKGGSVQFIKAFSLLFPTLGSSIGLAVIGAFVIVLIGFASAYLLTINGSQTTGKLFTWLLLFIFAIPSTVFGISLIKFYNHAIFDFIYSGYAIIIIGYAGKFSFISSKLIANAIKQIPNSLFEAAQIQGSKPYRQITKILLPLILPTLFAAIVLSFIFCLSELGTSIMLYPPGTEIMPIKVFTIMANAPQSLTSSMSLVVFAITLVIISFFFLIVKIYQNKYSYYYD